MKQVVYSDRPALESCVEYGAQKDWKAETSSVPWQVSASQSQLELIITRQLFVCTQASPSMTSAMIRMRGNCHCPCPGHFVEDSDSVT